MQQGAELLQGHPPLLVQARLEASRQEVDDVVRRAMGVCDFLQSSPVVRDGAQVEQPHGEPKGKLLQGDPLQVPAGQLHGAFLVGRRVGQRVGLTKEHHPSHVNDVLPDRLVVAPTGLQGGDCLAEVVRADGNAALRVGLLEGTLGENGVAQRKAALLRQRPELAHLLRFLVIHNVLEHEGNAAVDGDRFLRFICVGLHLRTGRGRIDDLHGPVLRACAFFRHREPPGERAQLLRVSPRELGLLWRARSVQTSLDCPLARNRSALCSTARFEAEAELSASAEFVTQALLPPPHVAVGGRAGLAPHLRRGACAAQVGAGPG
mmetsp:Transcript_45491/g.132444  ORF Transcript_45491/g.132444 Transcript_45491/m.132444 type:complete len:320 (-) Transcript_45491:109-1068(-)